MHVSYLQSAGRSSWELMAHSVSFDPTLGLDQNIQETLYANGVIRCFKPSLKIPNA
jgi:hypothetical protein